MLLLFIQKMKMMTVRLLNKKLRKGYNLNKKSQKNQKLMKKKHKMMIS